MPTAGPPPTTTRSLEPDETLVRRARAGDRHAFSRLVQRYEQSALVAARSILQSWHDARDAVQDAFVSAYTQLHRLWSPHKFGPWFLRIVRRHALWHRRRRTARSRNLAPLATDPPHPTADPTPAFDLPQLLARLPAQEYLVASLRHVNELSVADIARITGRPVGTVTKQLSRAYARMRPWLDAER
jgi:RNA polymerase sigma-70 factor (ECF subfamily)